MRIEVGWACCEGYRYTPDTIHVGLVSREDEDQEGDYGIGSV